MLPNSGMKAPLRWIDLLLRLTIVFTVSWFLYANFVARELTLPYDKNPDLQSASRALQSGNTTLARALFDRFLAAHPATSAAFDAVCLLCDENHHPELMEEYAKRGVQQCNDASAPERAQLYRLLSQAYADNGKSQAMMSIAAARQALALDPDNPETLNALGYEIADSSTDIAQLDEAEKVITLALKSLNAGVSLVDRSDQLAMCEDSYGWVLYKKGLYGPQGDRASYFARAIDALVQATNDLPAQTPGEVAKICYYHLAVVYRATGRFDDAHNALRVALHYDPNYKDALDEERQLTHAVSGSVAPVADSPTSPNAGSPPAFTPLQTRPAGSTPQPARPSRHS